MDSNTVLKKFWESLIMIVLVFFLVWILGILIKPIYAALIVTSIIFVWRFLNILNGLKYYWNKLWKKISNR
jgi:hypothetical protein